MGTTRLKSRRRQDQGLKWPRITMAILATIGVIDTGSITFNRWGWIGSLSCPGGAEGCDKVLNSPWGSVLLGNGFEIPLSLFGLFSYLAILLMAIVPLLPGLTENKADLSRKTWWGLFLTACVMAVFSLILIWLMIFKIKAFCFFCFVSAFISITIFGLTLIGGGWDDFGELLFRGFILGIAVLLGGLIWASAADPKQSPLVNSLEVGISPAVKTQSTPDSISLAKHLKASGIVQYSAYWCPHCHEQKEMFGKEAVSELKIVECAEDGKNSQRSLCEAKGITGYPSWEINGKLYSGIQQLQDLADLSGYPGTRNF
ncbi:vitamin K epoxide reductase family protein [Prochlorococcus sp. MIT 1307]|uniref:vitamin K epoxide reductase family protein n=1 Tax=Prochlorococcus sp. MIT 1307 TaxID=3096219 RepID=UPI002A75BD2A|nr:vitamin K epoxide reductase family protein [Prochlorococcus sp. MIT 1307]